MKNYEIFAARLKVLRKEKGLTQKQLAEQMETSTSSIISYENAQRFPSSAVIGLLSQYFSVSREYLLGESNERSADRSWDDPEIIEAVRESLPIQLSKLNALLKIRSAQEQKLTFDILEELSHVLNLESQEQRVTSMSLLQSVFTASTHYADICVNAFRDTDPAARIDKVKQTTLVQYSQALNEAVFSLPD